MSNNLYQEAQRDDWHGQIVPRRWRPRIAPRIMTKYVIDDLSFNLPKQLEELSKAIALFDRQCKIK